MSEPPGDLFQTPGLGEPSRDKAFPELSESQSTWAGARVSYQVDDWMSGWEGEESKMPPKPLSCVTLWVTRTFKEPQETPPEFC